MLRSSRRTVRNSSSVSRWNDWRRLPSKSGESGRAFCSSRRYSHCDAKFVTSASAFASASIRRTWRSSVGRRAQPALGGDGQQLVVGNAAPQEERQPRCQLEVGDAEGRPRPRPLPARARSGRGTADRRGSRATARSMPASNPSSPFGFDGQAWRGLRDRTPAPCRARGSRPRPDGGTRAWPARRESCARTAAPRRQRPACTRAACGGSACRPARWR